MSLRKMPPRNTSFVAPEPGPVAGVDNLPLPSGVNMKLKGEREKESEAVGLPVVGEQNGYRECDGDNPKIADVSKFASGQDVRSFGSSPKSDPSPGMPGA